MRQSISLFSIILAALAILVHAAVPHHELHHALETVCDSPSPDSPCDNPECSGDCFVCQTYIGGCRLLKSEESIAPLLDYRDFPVSLCIIEQTIRQITSDNTGSSFDFPPYLPGLHLLDASGSTGLRAPPAC